MHWGLIVVVYCQLTDLFLMRTLTVRNQIKKKLILSLSCSLSLTVLSWNLLSVFTWRHGGHVDVQNSSERSFGNLTILLCILPLFCTPTWPSHHVSENQEYAIMHIDFLKVSFRGFFKSTVGRKTVDFSRLRCLLFVRSLVAVSK